MRNISFALTTEAYEVGRKDVTRRNGWATLLPGTFLGAVRKAQGIPKGGKVERLNPPTIQALAVSREPLRRMTDDPAYGAVEVVREGFPHLTPAEFVAMYCEHNGCEPGDDVTRIEFRQVAAPPADNQKAPTTPPEAEPRR